MHRKMEKNYVGQADGQRKEVWWADKTGRGKADRQGRQSQGRQSQRQGEQSGGQRERQAQENETKWMTFLKFAGSILNMNNSEWERWGKADYLRKNLKPCLIDC